jgi:hypothetical protein
LTNVWENTDKDSSMSSDITGLCAVVMMLTSGAISCEVVGRSLDRIFLQFKKSTPVTASSLTNEESDPRVSCS